ncbi:MAG: hypothetical protein ACR2NL_09030 [Acidimicrobiia bacterium]
MTKTAYLRVYSPETTASEETVPGFVRSYGLLSESEGEASWVADWNGKRLVCPRNLRLRVLESTVAFANAFQGFGGGIIPEAAAKAADHELREYQDQNPTHRSHVLTSAWHVPVRWFGAFDPQDKDIYEVAGASRLRYRVDLEVSRTRIGRILEVLRRLQMFQGPVEEIDQLDEWLSQFASDSMLELDYADVSDLFDPQELVFDDSVELIQESLNSLEKGDLMAAGENYGRVVARWAPAFSVTFSN